MTIPPSLPRDPTLSDRYDPRARRFLDQVAAMLNSLVEGGSLVMTGPSAWSLGGTPGCVLYIGPSGALVVDNTNFTYGTPLAAGALEVLKPGAASTFARLMDDGGSYFYIGHFFDNANDIEVQVCDTVNKLGVHVVGDSTIQAALVSATSHYAGFFTDGTRQVRLADKANLVALSAADGTHNAALCDGTYAAKLGGKLAFSGSSSGVTTFIAAAAAAGTYTLPSVDGSSGDVLSTNGSGVLSWQPSGGGSGMAIGGAVTGGTPTYYLFVDGSGNLAQAAPTAGTVTSVDGSGGSTGLTLTGGAITSSGTLTIGGTLAAGYGGTGLSSFSDGDIIYWTNATPTRFTSVPIGTTGKVLVVAAGAPAWGVAPAVGGGTGYSLYAAGDLIYADTTTTFAKINVGSIGQVFTVVAGVPSWSNTITDGTRSVIFTNGSYAIDVTAGTIRTMGTSGNTYRWENATTAPATQTLLSLPLNVYGQGTITDLLGDPDFWLLADKGGTAIKIPCYLA